MSAGALATVLGLAGLVLLVTSALTPEHGYTWVMFVVGIACSLACYLVWAIGTVAS